MTQELVVTKVKIRNLFIGFVLTPVVTLDDGEVRVQMKWPINKYQVRHNSYKSSKPQYA